MKPLIGITPEVINLERPDGRSSFCRLSYTRAIEMAGGVPFVFPLTDDTATLNRLLDQCDGLLLSGGGDVHADFYAPKLSLKSSAQILGAEKVRDYMEIHLTNWSLAANLPVFGICRGLQVVNVALGGTLKIDIPNHQNPKPDALAHKIKWTRRNRLWKALRGCNLVNTSHHQAVGRLAAGLEVVAIAPDGIIEAVEHRKARFVCAVQFHPERLLNVDRRFLELFETFVNQAQSHRSSSFDCCQ